MAKPPDHDDHKDVEAPDPAGPARGRFATSAWTWARRHRVRKEIAAYCDWCVRHNGAIHYAQYRPVLAIRDRIPKWMIPSRLDCSSFAIRAYQVANAPSPSLYGYTGYGSTYDMEPHGRRIQTPALGDLVFYDGHVAVVTQLIHEAPLNPVIVSHGSETGPQYRRANYRSDLSSFRRYF